VDRIDHDLMEDVDGYVPHMYSFLGVSKAGTRYRFGCVNGGFGVVNYLRSTEQQAQAICVPCLIRSIIFLRNVSESITGHPRKEDHLRRISC
jgi:hypothetical protein